MMKTIIQRAASAAIVLSFLFVIPATAVEPSSSVTRLDAVVPNQIAFQIPMNNYCSAENSLDFSFQVSNAEETPADITLYLYQKDGSAYNEEGTSYGEIQSNFMPGKAVTLKGHQTGVFHLNFGNGKKCNERVYLGRIAANSAQVSLLARGWVSNRSGTVTTGSEPIIINDNKVFNLAGVQ
jgi:hypothetical protein